MFLDNMERVGIMFLHNMERVGIMFLHNMKNSLCLAVRILSDCSNNYLYLAVTILPVLQ